MTPTEAGPQINPEEFLDQEEIIEDENELEVDHQYLDSEEDNAEADVYAAVEQMFPKSDDSKLDNNDSPEDLYTPREPANIGDVLHAKRQTQDRTDKLNETLIDQAMPAPDRQIQAPAEQQITTLEQPTPVTPTKEIDREEHYKRA